MKEEERELRGGIPGGDDARQRPMFDSQLIMPN